MLQLPNEIHSTDDLETLWTFLEQIDKGYAPTPEEQAVLDSIVSLNAFPDSRITIIPHSISLLHNICLLSLFGTQITDCSPLAGLTSLAELSLSRTLIADCNPLAGLTSLTELSLSRTLITDCSPLAELTSLTKLYLSDTQITDCSPLAGLISLTKLDLSDTQITDCSPLAGLTSLTKLDLSGLRLHSLPKEFLTLEIPFIDEHYIYSTGINLHDVQLRTQPVSLFFQPREMIQAYFDSPQVPIQEAKVIFLGEGGAGKTHTIKRILNHCKNEDYKTDTTPGIEISPYDGNYKGKALRINFWDFGGQEIMHAMHRCFLTERSLYVVILTNRHDLMPHARFWLKNIQTFAKNSPVLLAVNRWDNINLRGLDMDRLQKDYPQLCPIPMYYSAKDPSEEAFHSFLNEILKEASKLDSTAMTFPKEWADIRQDLIVRAEKENYISLDSYYKICEDRGLKDPTIRDWLLHWFNDMGICFSYHDRPGTNPTLQNYKVLQPRWLTNAVYRLINSGQKYAEKGRILLSNIEDLLKTPSGDPKEAVLPNVSYHGMEYSYVLEVMRKFNLSYKINDRYEFIPALCSEDTPKNLHPTQYKTKLSYVMEYTYLPDTVIHRLMIRCYEKLHTDFVWRKGLRLEEELAGLTAVVDMGNDDATLRIDIYSDNILPPWKLLNKLRNTLAQINKDLGLQAEDHILIQGKQEEIPQSVNRLLLAKEHNVKELTIIGKEEFLGNMSIDKILGETFGEELLRKAEDLAQKENRSITYIFYNIHNGDVYEAPVTQHNGNVNCYQGMDDAKLFEILEYLEQNHSQSQEALVNAFIAHLEALNTADALEQAKKLKEEKDQKPGIYTGFAKRMKQLSEIGGGLAVVGKVCNPLWDNVKPWLAENITKIPEIIDRFKDFLR